MEAIEPILTLRKVYHAETMRREEPEEWQIPIYAKTVMGVIGTTYAYTTVLHDYFERNLYRIIRMTSDLKKIW